MQNTILNQTTKVVVRGCSNYPTVVKDMGKEIQNQFLTCVKQIFSLLRLLLKFVLISTFPVWVIPFSVTVFTVLRLCERNPQLLKN